MGSAEEVLAPVVMGRVKARNFPSGCAQSVITLVDIDGAGCRKLKKTFADLRRRRDDDGDTQAGVF